MAVKQQIGGHGYSQGQQEHINEAGIAFKAPNEEWGPWVGR